MCFTLRTTYSGNSKAFVLVGKINIAMLICIYFFISYFGFVSLSAALSLPRAGLLSLVQSQAGCNDLNATLIYISQQSSPMIYCNLYYPVTPIVSSASPDRWWNSSALVAISWEATHSPDGWWAELSQVGLMDAQPTKDITQIHSAKLSAREGWNEFLLMAQACHSWITFGISSSKWIWILFSPSGCHNLIKLWNRNNSDIESELGRLGEWRLQWEVVRMLTEKWVWMLNFRIFMLRSWD